MRAPLTTELKSSLDRTILASSLNSIPAPQFSEFMARLRGARNRFTTIFIRDHSGLLGRHTIFGWTSNNGTTRSIFLEFPLKLTGRIKVGET